jgi:arylsulfatase A-like enzyme
MRKRGNRILRGSDPAEEQEYLTDAFGREAVAFIERNKHRPFFLCLSFNAIHTPLQATEAYLDRHKEIEDKKRRTIAAMLTAMDDNVGRVLRKLRDLRLEESALIFFLSDNGAASRKTRSGNHPLRGGKGQLYEGGICVPFFVQWRERLPMGATYKEPVSALDILPTAVAAAGGDVLPEWRLDGADLFPYLTGEKSGVPHERLFWRQGSNYAALMGRWKLVVQGRPTPRLFDLENDPGEKKDLASEELGIARNLRKAFEEWSGTMAEPSWGPRGGRVREQKRKKSTRPSPLRQPKDGPPVSTIRPHNEARLQE